MRSIDLTHKITEQMPVFPGSAPPDLHKVCSLERDGFRETLLSLHSHTGTHMDAPAHLLPRGKTLDQMPIEQFVGPGLLVDCQNIPEGGVIGMDRLSLYDGALNLAQFVLFYTGWDKPSYYGSFPVPDPVVLRHLAALGKKGVGTDAPSIDPIGADPLACHKIALEAQMVILENLANLSDLCQSVFTLLALPLHYEGADGAPARVLAFEDDVAHSLFYDLIV